MTVTETRNAAVAFMEAMAADNTHGYDQASRWGPDYDCSSLVISAWKKAGVPLTCTYTGNMRGDMLTHGFKDVTKEVNLATGSGLKKADVLLHETHHTAMYIGDGKLIHAAGNERGGATGGKTGDQTGKEICVTGYFNFPWQCVLRYSKAEEAPTGTNTYVVKAGDSLWGIAQKELGNGARYPEIMKLNNLTVNSVIHPGQVLYLPGDGKTTVNVELPVLKKGDKGDAVKSLQTLLQNHGIQTDADGDFGEATWVSVCDLQRQMNVSVNGEVKASEWKALIGGVT